MNDLAAVSSFTSLCDVLIPVALKGWSSEAASRSILEKWFIFCVVWSVGGAVDSHGRQLLDQCLREIDPKVMPSRSIYEYFIDPNTNEFKLWSAKVTKVCTTASTAFHNIVVPTIDTVRNSFILDSLADGGYRVLVTGARGTGKTLIAKSFLQRQPARTQHITIGLSTTTGSNFVQSIIDASLEKRTKGTLGPQIGSDKLVVFIDDFNMPKKTSEESPFQPPLELLRQLIDYGGWYDRAKCSWQKVVDTQLLCAMAHSTGGREVISSRTQSRFFVMNCVEYETKQTVSIFRSLLECKLPLFPDTIKALFEDISKATMVVFSAARTKFLPVPGKAHYVFDLRDLLRVAHGMCLVNSSGHEIQTKEGFLDLWIHECMRTFSDRFVDDCSKDEQQFWEVLADVNKKQFSYNINGEDEILQSAPVFSHLALVDDPRKDDSSPPYRAVTKMPVLQKCLTQYLNDYNDGGSFIPMSLVLFNDAMKHICRIQRVLHLERGNMLFIGVGGSGRESLTRLAAFITGYTFFKIEASQKYRRREFLEDLKVLCIQCGVENKRILFFLKDADIKDEIFLEDISSLLSSGEVHGAFGKDDIVAACDGVRKDALLEGIEETEDSLWRFFVERVRKNLRVIIALSSIGPALSSRIQSYPALMNCAIMNWFNPWPQTALEQIATRQLQDMEDQSSPLSANLPKCFASIHHRSASASEDMIRVVGRFNYVTPTNYLELIRTFKKFYGLKGNELNAQKAKLSGGLHKLQAGRDQVATMRIKLEKKQKIVAESQRNCENMLEKIMLDKRHTEQQKRTVEIESEKIAAEEKECSKIAAEAEADLAIALPALKNALDQVDKLDKSSIAELKAYANPPTAVEKVLSCVMILLENPTDWANAKRVMGDTNFLSNLKSFDKDDVNGNILAKVGQYVKLPSFASTEITKVSKAAGALCAWCHAIHLYAGVAKQVAPKRARLKAAAESLFEKQSDLKNAKDALESATSKLTSLKQRYDQSVEEKNKLAQEATVLGGKLDRAEKLVSGLSLEYDRWKSSIEELKTRTVSLLGDILVSSAFLSYGGPFETSFRSKLLTEWISVVQSHEIEISKDYSLTYCLGNDHDVQTWNEQGLPKDSFSTENALIISSSNRWPLIIDPQGQANRWITAMLGDSLKVLDMKNGIK